MKSFAWMLGKGLQFVGLLILPVALIRGFETDDPRTELLLLAVGAIVFLGGWILARAGGETS